MSQGVSLPPLRRIRSGLADLRRRARLSLGLQGLATVVLLLVFLCLLSFALDRTLRLSWGVRATALVSGMTALGWLVWTRLAIPLNTPLSDPELARLVEREHPQLEWRMLSAVQFGDPHWTPGPETSRELAALVMEDAERMAGEVAFESPVPGAPMARSAGRGALVLAAAIALIGAFQGAASTWFERNVLLSTTAEWPKDTHLTLEHPELVGGTIRLARGEDLSFVVRAEGVIPSRVYLDTLSTEDQAGERLVLDALGDGRFRTTLEQVNEGFSFTVWGGDDELGPFQVEVIRRPWITELSFHAVPPAYTGLPPRDFGVEAGSITLPLDTLVEVRVGLSKPLAKAWIDEFRAGGAEVAQVHTGVPQGDGTTFTSQVRLSQAGAGVFRVEVTDLDGYGFEQATRFGIVAQTDAAPDLKLRLAGVGLNVTPQAQLKFLVSAQDDYGLTSGALHYKGAGGAEGEPELASQLDLSQVLAGKTEAQAAGSLRLEALELKPKMSLTLWAEGSDGDPRGPNVGASPSLQLRVVTAEQLLNELLRRLHEQRLELERMIGEEEKLAQGLSGRDETTLERASRTHADVGRTVTRAADVVEGVVAELITNDLLEQSTWDRLSQGVVEPLRDVVGGSLEQARRLADATSVASEDDRPRLFLQAGTASLRVVNELKTIVERMGRIEDMAELVALLKKIINEQRGLLDETKRE